MNHAPRPLTRRIVRVLLASPGDLEDERRAARELVNEVNQNWAPRLGVQIELVVWEDLPPQAGRPQEVVNRYSDDYDHFIGVLWKRWGQPTGAADSGFKEEFDLAWQRFESTGAPGIAVFFKKLSDDERGDPGLQLAKVLAFKQSIKNTQQLLYAEFDDTNWVSRLRLVIEQIAWERSTVSQSAIGAAQFAPDSTKAAPSEIGEGDPSQLVGVALRFHDAITAASSQPADKGGGVWSLSKQDALRLHIAAGAEAYRHMTSQLLGAHEMNALLAVRDQVTLTPGENWYVLCSLLAGMNSGVVPGWWWFRDDDPKPGLVLGAMADDSSVCASAFALLTKLGIAPSDPLIVRLDLLKRSLQRSDRVTRDAALTWFAVTAGRGDLARLAGALNVDESELLSNADTSNHVLEVLARIDPRRALAKIVSGDNSVSQEVVDALVARAAHLGVRRLKAALVHRVPSVRRLAFAALSAKGQLNNKTVARLLADADVSNRRIAARELLDKPSLEMLEPELAPDIGEGSESTRLAVDLLSLHGYSTLRQRLDWTRYDIYAALGVHFFANFSSTIRSDLLLGFSHWRKSFMESLSADGLDEEAMRPWDRLSGFLDTQLTEAALMGLVENGSAADRKHALKYFEHDRDTVQRLAIRLLGRVGTYADGNFLLERAGTLPPHLRDEAVQIGLQLIAAAGGGATTRRLEECLYHDSEAARIAALDHLTKRLSVSQLDALLTRYQSKRPYFYNVVAALDRLLFAPPPISQSSAA